MKTTLTFIFLLYSSFISAQPNDAPTGLSSLQNNIVEGVVEGLSWHDVLLATYMLSKNSLQLDDDDKIAVYPSTFESGIQNNIGRDGRISAGSMDPNYFPNIIFYSRLAYTLGKNLIDPATIDKDDYKHIFLFGKSLLYTLAVTDLAKGTINRKRPDGSDTRSFFSGHTSTLFAASSFLYRELDDYIDTSPITANDDLLRNSFKTISFLTLYGWASYVGYSRMQDNKHYLSDVIIGAAVGTLISNLIYDYYVKEDSPLLENVNIGIINRSPSISFRMNF